MELENKIKALTQVINYFNLNTKLFNFENFYIIQPNHIKIIDEKFKQILRQNFQITHEELKVYYRIKYDTFVNEDSISKFIEFLANRDFILREKNEKILKSNALVVLLAVDGFQGYKFYDLKNYVVNLQTDKNLDIHKQIVRDMHSLQCLTVLHSNDAIVIICFCLLTIFEKNINFDNVIKTYKENIYYYLLKNSKIYPNIKKAIKNMNEIMQLYESNMNKIPIIAKVKTNQLISYLT